MDKIIEDNIPSSESFSEESVKIERLDKAGIKVVTGAGNDYAENYINLYAIAGAVPIGALSHDGKRIAPYSNQNSLTSIYRVGDFIGRQVSGGIDINNDGKADFNDTLLSGEDKNADIVRGVPASKFVDTANYMYLRGMPYDTAQKFAKEYGELFFLSGMGYFRAGKDGNAKFDPANNGDTSQVSVNWGTSYATPNICGK